MPIKKILIPSLLSLLILSSVTYCYFSFSQNNEETISTKKSKLDERYINDEKRRAYFHTLVADPETGKIPEGIYEQELQWAQHQPNRKSKVSNTYNSLGPNNKGGRTRAIGIDKRNSNIMLAGGVSSGVFRTTNGGTTWTKVSASNTIHNVTSIAQDTRTGHEDTWYYSTGEAPTNSASAGGTAIYMGNGMYKSTDNGVTWSRLIASNSSTLESFNNRADFIQRVVVNPSNGDIYFAALGSIHRSQNGGTTWTSVLSNTGSFSNSHYTDIVVTPSGRFYAAFSGATSNTIDGIWTSTTGNSGGWTRIANSTLVTGWNSQSSYGRVVLAYAPSATDEIYALYYNNVSSTCASPAAEAELFKGVRTTGTSFTWTNLSANLPDETGCSSGNDPFAVQKGYDLCIAVKPNDKNTVYIGGTNLYRSTDGFSSTSNTTRIGGYANTSGYSKYTNHHPDIHYLTFNSTSNDTLYTGSDGGIHKSLVTAATPAWISLNNDYVTYQYYHVAVSPDAYKEHYIGGCQDNGTVRSLGSAAQTEIFSGDGCAVGIGQIGGDYTEYISTQLGNVYRRDKSKSAHFYDAKLAPVSTTTVNQSLFVTYFHLDPDNGNLLYYANGPELFRQTSASTANQSTGWTLMTGANTSIGTSKIRSMATTRGPYDATKASLFIGTEAGKVFRMNDPKNTAASAAVVDITPTGMSSGGIVSDISVNPRNDDTILVVYSNYNVNSIWWTGNANAASPTWVNMQGGSPEFVPSARSCEIVVNNNVVEYYVGSSVGLFSNTSATTTSSWSREGSSSLQYSVVNSLDYRPSDNKLFIGTHGNGAFESTIGTPTKKVIASTTSSSTRILGPNETVQFTNSTDEIIAEVKNLSAHNYGKTTVTIDNAGTGTQNFGSNTSAAKKIMEKTILITPTTNNASGNVQITTYFSNTEVTNWETATSQLRANLNQIKSSGSISSGTNSNTVYGTSPVINNSYLGNNVAITATYSNGFSGLGAGLNGSSGPLPLTLVSFDANRKDENIELHWQTSTELNSSHFEIEKLMKQEFVSIGQVEASGNSNSIIHYDFVDHNPVGMQNELKYRLKMVDIDGSSEYSKIVSVKGIRPTQRINIFPSPFSDELTISANNYEGVLQIAIYNLNGDKVLDATKISGTKKIDVSQLTDGIYFVTLLENDRKIETRKIIKN